jgi:hypothetical protein
MRLIEKFESLLVLTAIAVGLALGQLSWVAEHAARVIVPCLMPMLCGVFLQIPVADIREALRDYRVTGLSLGINFLWTPLFAWALGALFLREAPDLWVRLLMLMVTPCTDWYLVFTGLARGNVALGTALLPWNLILQLVLLPVYLLLFAGTLVHIRASVLVGRVWRGCCSCLWGWNGPHGRGSHGRRGGRGWKRCCCRTSHRRNWSSSLWQSSQCSPPREACSWNNPRPFSSSCPR